VPLVLLLHDRGGSGKEAERAYGWSEKADKEGFIVAYPDATGNPSAWNVAYTSGRGGSTDVTFLRSLIDRLQGTYTIDPLRIYVAGHGSGAMMAYLLGAELSRRVAAIGVVGGSVGAKPRDLGVVSVPPPARPVSVIAFHGTKDDAVPYDGGYYLSAKETLRFWVRSNACSEPVKRETIHGGKVIRESYTGCDEEREVVFYTLEGSDHRWPGASDPRLYAAPPVAELSATDLMWEFFARHPR
jgi:polyhydroxybutyrate depolymerase